MFQSVRLVTLKLYNIVDNKNSYNKLTETVNENVFIYSFS